MDDLGIRAYMGSGTFLSGGRFDLNALPGCVYMGQTRDDRSYSWDLLSVQPARQGTGPRPAIGNRGGKAGARISGSRTMDLRVISARAEQFLPFYQHLDTSSSAPNRFPRLYHKEQ